MKTTQGIGTEGDRKEAWDHFRRPQIRHEIPGIHQPTERLWEIAEKYDDLVQRAHAYRAHEISETDVLAGLLVIRALRDKLQRDERRLLGAARDKGVTWARIARALGVKSRQAAERRFMQLKSEYDEVRDDTRTQAERVEGARAKRQRDAEQRWVGQHAEQVRELARQLAAVPDLQQRADASHEARLRAKEAVVDGRQPSQEVSMSWPVQLREAIAEEQRARARADDAEHDGSVVDSDCSFPEMVAMDRLSRLYRHVVRALDPDVVDLTDQPKLLRAITALRAYTTSHKRSAEAAAGHHGSPRVHDQPRSTAPMRTWQGYRLEVGARPGDS